jgi:hypothetical protein
MENNSEHLLENDAARISAQITEIVEHSNESGSLQLSENQNTNRAVVLSNQTNTSAVFNINNSRSISFGNVFNVGLSSGNLGLVAEPNVPVAAASRRSPYNKTPTIKAMLESSDPITSAFLDIAAEFFGLRWREITILLQINQLFVDRMYEDYNERGGTKEVTTAKFLCGEFFNELF